MAQAPICRVPMMRTSYENIEDSDVPRPLLHLVKDLDGKHVDGHNRLRSEVEERERRLIEVERQCTAHNEQLQNIGRRTTDVSALRFTPSMVGAFVLVCASIVGGFYGSTWGIRDDVRDIKTTIIDQAELRKAETKLQDERANAIHEQLTASDKRFELLRLEVQQLREQVLFRMKGSAK